MRLKADSHFLLRSAVFCISVASAWGFAKDTETPRRQEEYVTTSAHTYHIQLGGTLDAENTRDPISYGPWKQVFEPMRVVRMENTGESDVRNPWVVVNGRRNWRTVADIVDDALRSYGDPAGMAPAEKARAIWEFLRRHRFHATTGDLEVRDPVKMLNVYGYALCGDNAAVLMDLWRAAGFQSRRGFPYQHCVNEVWYDGGWHLWDADESMMYLDRDNQTVVSELKLAGDHDLGWRSYHDPGWAAQFGYTGTISGEFPSHAEHTMMFTLRPGEALEWRWSQIPRAHHAGENPLYGGSFTELTRWGGAWEDHCNGKLIYTPPLRSAAAQKRAEERNVAWSQNTAEPAVFPQKAGEAASLTWKIESPYVIVGATLKAAVRSAGGDSFVFQLSTDGTTWQDVTRVSKTGKAQIDENLNQFLPQAGPAIYSYFLRAEFQAAGAANTVGLDSIAIDSDVQMAPLGLPSLRLGDNTVSYVDDTKEPHAVKITFHWAEMAFDRIPTAPAAPVYPANSAEVEGTSFVFRWVAAKVKDAAIGSYYFQMSDDPEMRTALSPAFETLLPQNAKSSLRFEIPGEGLLNPGQRYYWRVRAKSEGVYGKWGPIWSFVCLAPGVPVNVRIGQPGPDTYALAWDANPNGRKPVEFEIYGSDERGFTANPDQVYAGEQKLGDLFPDEKIHTFPANLLAKAKASPFVLVPEHAYYRVVAVDEKGHRSGASDYAAAPRPYIYTKPPAVVRVGTAFHYEAKTVTSIGDLYLQDTGNPDSVSNASNWKPDKPQFSLETELSRCGNLTPSWLSIDAKTGMLSGTPKAKDIGEYQINVKVEISGAGVHIQSFPLKVVE
jgi:hypothetical protein